MPFSLLKKHKKYVGRLPENTASGSHSSNDVQVDGLDGASHSSSLSNGTSHTHGTASVESNRWANGRNNASGAASVERNYSQTNGIMTATVARDQTPDQIEVDWGLETVQNEENDARAASKLRTAECTKHPGHRPFIPIHSLQIRHLPPPYQNEEWVKFIQLKGSETVQIVVSYTSQNRPEDIGFANFKGTTNKRTGSGTAFILNMDNTEDCHCPEIPGPHKVSGMFKVMTVAHVVFDDAEAQSTVIKFFFDDDNATSTIVKARGVRVSHIDVQRNRSVVECRTHDLTLYQRLSHTRKERMQLIQESLAAQVNHEPMVVLISHPHGLSKCVSIGKLLDIKEAGEVKTTKDGIELIDCILTYDTPTCPGTGGGSINLIGKGEVCFAFAPHCASHSNGHNISGLGWTKYVKTLQLRAN